MLQSWGKNRRQGLADTWTSGQRDNGTSGHTDKWTLGHQDSSADTDTANTCEYIFPIKVARAPYGKLNCAIAAHANDAYLSAARQRQCAKPSQAVQIENKNGNKSNCDS